MRKGKQAMDTTNAQWYNVAVYYYEENKDQLILDAVQPLFQQLKPQVERVFFTRHWLRGPHLRLRFFTTEKLFNTVVKPAIEEHVGRYLREHPSTTVLNEEKLLPVYQKLAIAEQEKGPVVPFYPNNSIQYLPYDRRLHVLHNDRLVELIEQFYVESNDLVFQMLEYIRQGNSRLLLCLDLMFTSAHTSAWPITTGFVSYRSHAEGYIIRTPNPAATRKLFDDKYKAQSVALGQRLRQLLDALNYGQDDFPFILAWSLLMKRYWVNGMPLIQTGAIDIIPGGRDKALEYEEHWQELIPNSTFHSRFYENHEGRARLFANPHFQGYRLVLNLVYLHLNRLGINPLDRALLGHLAAETVEEVCNVSAVELVS